jgi:hypothetical protein
MAFLNEISRSLVLYTVTKLTERANFHILYSEDGDRRFLRNVGTNTPEYTATHPRSPQP